MNDDLAPEYRQMLTQMMESQAYRELAAAHMFGYGPCPADNGPLDFMTTQAVRIRIGLLVAPPR